MGDAARMRLDDGLVAGAVAAVVSGAPSTIHALVSGRDVREATFAAGSILLRDETRPLPLLGAAGVVHGALSLGWALALAAVLPRRRAVLWGTAAGLAIAALDLGVVGRRIPRIRALAQPPQWADHAMYGAVVGWVVTRRRARRAVD